VHNFILTRDRKKWYFRSNLYQKKK